MQSLKWKVLLYLKASIMRGSKYVACLPAEKYGITEF